MLKDSVTVWTIYIQEQINQDNLTRGNNMLAIDNIEEKKESQ